MSTQEQREKLAALLESVVAGRLPAGEALAETEKWADVPWKERLLNHAWHALVHYEHDADIRSRDPSYAQSQREGLRMWMKRLRGVR